MMKSMANQLSYIFMTGETVSLVWFFIFPLLGAGLTGHNRGIDMAMGSMIHDWRFAIPPILIVNRDMFEKAK